MTNTMMDAGSREVPERATQLQFTRASTRISRGGRRRVTSAEPSEHFCRVGSSTRRIRVPCGSSEM